MEDWGAFRYILPALGGFFAVYFLNRSASKHLDENECYSGFLVNLVMLGGTIMFIIVAWVLFFANQPDDGLNDEAWLKPAYICVVLIFLFFTPDTYMRRISWDEEQLTIKRFLRPTKVVKWNDIDGLKYYAFFQYWRLGFKDGTGVMFYDLMKNSQKLIGECNVRAIHKK